MTGSETIRYEMLVRVREFGQTHRDLFPPTSVGGQAFDAVAAAVEQLGAQAVSKATASREGVSSRALARTVLRRRLTAMARCARVIAGEHSGFDAPFRKPIAETDQALLIAGRVFVKEAEGVTERFMEYGMPPDFLATLSGAVERFAQALQSVETGRDGHTAARASIQTALDSGLAAVRKLDVIIPNRFHDDPVTLAVWRRDRRMEFPRRSRKAPMAASPVEEAVGGRQ